MRIPSELRRSCPARYVLQSIWFLIHTMSMTWVVELADEFVPEFESLHEDVQTEVLALARVLQRFGPE